MADHVLRKFTKARGTGKLAVAGWAVVETRTGRPPLLRLATRPHSAGMPASARSRAASRQPSKSSGATRITRWASIIGPSQARQPRTVPTVAGCGAIRERRSARSVSKAGRQSSATINGRTLATDRVASQHRQVAAHAICARTGCGRLPACQAGNAHSNSLGARLTSTGKRREMRSVPRRAWGRCRAGAYPRHRWRLHFLRRKAVKSHQPVGLVNAMLAQGAADASAATPRWRQGWAKKPNNRPGAGQTYRKAGAPCR